MNRPVRSPPKWHKRRRGTVVKFAPVKGGSFKPDRTGPEHFLSAAEPWPEYFLSANELWPGTEIPQAGDQIEYNLRPEGYAVGIKVIERSRT